jgi:hypothetical protein
VDLLFSLHFRSFSGCRICKFLVLPVPEVSCLTQAVSTKTSPQIHLVMSSRFVKKMIWNLCTYWLFTCSKNTFWFHKQPSSDSKFQSFGFICILVLILFVSVFVPPLFIH